MKRERCVGGRRVLSSFRFALTRPLSYVSGWLRRWCSVALAVELSAGVTTMTKMRARCCVSVR